MKKLSAFTLAEITIVLILLGTVILIIGRTAIGNYNQRLYEAKFNKISAKIASNIERDMLTRTGFRFNNYNPNTYRTAVLTDLSSTRGTIDNWSDTINITTRNNQNILINNNWSFDVLNDETVLAFDNNSTELIIDVNGRKGPNRQGQDIFIYGINNNNNRPAANGRRIWFNRR